MFQEQEFFFLTARVQSFTTALCVDPKYIVATLTVRPRGEER